MKLSNVFFSLLLTWLALVGFIFGLTCWKVDGVHGDPTLIVDEIVSLHQVVSSLEDTVRALESREALQDLPYNASLHILKSNDYLQGCQHVVDILEPMYGFSLTTDGLMKDKLLLQKLRQELKQLINRIKILEMTFKELEDSPPLNQFKVINYNPEVISLMHSKLDNLAKAFSSVAKRMKSVEYQSEVAVAGVNFLCNFLEEVTTWSRRRTLDSSI
ncbi:hypothetical protein MKW98_007436 [Papaver atlanticum]|uniref:Uncharacterized protein n=1 Tax=Papaver atlanticum TaxID=357466 RepID=A0AAD4XCV6_9MAGN|nr:hypothetical protein MKW98_007436 [Papaver atlanticum]